MKQYKASMDRTTKILTILVPLLLFFTVFIPSFTKNNPGSIDFLNPSPEVVFPFGLIILLVITFGFSPKAYAVDDRQLIIYRPFHRKFYSTTDMKSVSVVDKKDLSRSIRVFGVGGLFGYFGLFRNSLYGTMIWYATRRDQFVVIERSNGRTIVLTPDDPNSLVSELNEQIQR